MQASGSINEKFNKAYRQNFHKVRHFCYSYTQDISLSEDITQDVFETLWYKREAVDLDNEILPYLLVLAKNKCLNTLLHANVKHKYLERSYNRMLDDINTLALQELSVHRLYSKEIGLIYAKALGSMPEAVRKTWIAIRVEGNRYKKVAAAENVSVKTLERRITIATAILRKYLRDYIKLIVLILLGL